MYHGLSPGQLIHRSLLRLRPISKETDTRKDTFTRLTVAELRIERLRRMVRARDVVGDGGRWKSRVVLEDGHVPLLAFKRLVLDGVIRVCDVRSSEQILWFTDLLDSLCKVWELVSSAASYARSRATYFDQISTPSL